jgi:putative sugar O-methyltransferase
MQNSPWTIFFNERVKPYYIEAVATQPKEEKSKFWDVFDKQFQRIALEPTAWANFRRSGLSCGTEIGQRMSQRTTQLSGTGVNTCLSKKNCQILVERFLSLTRMVDQDFVEGQLDCVVGTPVVYNYNGLNLNLDELYNIYHSWQLTRIGSQLELPLDNVIEIGGGYGCLASKLKRVHTGLKWTSIDLPETQLSQIYYLFTLFPDATFSFGGSTPHAADFTFIPSHLAKDTALRDTDLVINCRSFMEMNPDVISNYFKQIQSPDDGLEPGALFYCVNAYSKGVVGSDIRIKEYPFDDRWDLLLSQPAWIQTHLHETLLKRTTLPQTLNPNFLFQSLPESAVKTYK